MPDRHIDDAELMRCINWLGLYGDTIYREDIRRMLAAGRSYVSIEIALQTSPAAFLFQAS